MWRTPPPRSGPSSVDRRSILSRCPTGGSAGRAEPPVALVGVLTRPAITPAPRTGRPVPPTPPPRRAAAPPPTFPVPVPEQDKGVRLLHHFGTADVARTLRPGPGHRRSAAFASRVRRAD